MPAIVKTLKPKTCFDLDRVGVGGFQALCENRMGEELPLNYFHFLLKNQCSIFGLDFTLFFFIYQGKIWVQNIKAIISLGPQLSPDFRLGEAIGFCEQDKAACFQILFAFIAKGSPLTRMRGGCVGTQLDRM